MLEKKAQGTFTVIVAAVIGLIIIVVVVLMLTGKLGAFSSGVESAVSCENTCKAIGADTHSSLLKTNCVVGGTYKKVQIMPGGPSGSFSDITLPNNECCCIWN